MIDSACDTISVLDITRVRSDQENPDAAVKSFLLPDPHNIKSIDCDLLIVGGSTAGISAALAASKWPGIKICLIEETDWLGGQMTSQGVPITDDGRNFQVETSGANRSYQLFREAIRNYYKRTYQLSEASLQSRYFNPG